MISDEETDYFCLITLIPVYLLPQFNTRTQYNLPCTTTRTQTDTLSLSTQSLQASSVLIKFYRSMLEFSLHHQFPFVYSFSKYNFLLKKAQIHKICMTCPLPHRQRKTKRNCTVRKQYSLVNSRLRMQTGNDCCL